MVVVVLFEALDLVMLVVLAVVAVAAVPALDGEVADPALRLPPAVEPHHLQVAQDVGLGWHPANTGGYYGDLDTRPPTLNPDTPAAGSPAALPQ